MRNVYLNNKVDYKVLKGNLLLFTFRKLLNICFILILHFLYYILIYIFILYTYSNTIQLENQIANVQLVVLF